MSVGRKNDFEYATELLHLGTIVKGFSFSNYIEVEQIFAKFEFSSSIQLLEQFALYNTNNPKQFVVADIFN